MKPTRVSGVGLCRPFNAAAVRNHLIISITFFFQPKVNIKWANEYSKMLCSFLIFMKYFQLYYVTVTYIKTAAISINYV